VANRFFDLLCQEAREACTGFQHIYLLLSGGMDSRIVAGVLAYLYRCDAIEAKPIGVTWGFSDSRDAVYAQQIAAALDFEWINIPFGPEILPPNIDATVRQLGLIHSPEMLHYMRWFENVPEDSIVLAGSYGDSIGRAEFAGLHLLQLKPRTPHNAYGVLVPSVFDAVRPDVESDLHELVTRAGATAPVHARMEHWMQGYRMRSGLCHALSIINQYSHIYQMFTAPFVYEYIWSLHPATRGDEVYAAMMVNHLPALARIPWARTNRAFRGQTVGAKRGLKDQYHEYTKWCAGPMYDELSRLVDPDWFAATGVFDAGSIHEMNRLVRRSRHRVGTLNDRWLWLAGFRRFVESLEASGRQLVIDTPENGAAAAPRRDSLLRRVGVMGATRARYVNATLKMLRATQRRRELKRLKEESLRRYPAIRRTSVGLAVGL
jgi:asparagine synthase (glutamine-hydrolysing)